MASLATNLDSRMLLLVTLLGFGLMCTVHPATMEDVSNLVVLPLWNQTNLSLSGKGLSGPIPPQLGGLTNLTYLDLSSNNLSGPIPPQLGGLTNLTYLDLSINNFSGPIPPELGNLTNLSELDLSNNSLSGPISLGAR
jgi:Leucine-rich repeat (LRR) protein